MHPQSSLNLACSNRTSDRLEPESTLLTTSHRQHQSWSAGLTFKSLQQGFIRLVHWYVHLYHLLNWICRFHQQTYITHLADAAAKMGMSWNVLMSYIFHPTSPPNSLSFLLPTEVAILQILHFDMTGGIETFLFGHVSWKGHVRWEVDLVSSPNVSVPFSICSTSTQQGLFFKIWSWDVSEKQKAANTKNLVLAANDCSFL